MKILGFIFSNKPNANAHVDYIVKKYNKALWSLNHIKRSGIDVKTILTVYCVMLRPLIEFCSPVYHPLISNEQNVRLEGLQKMALKIIYGFNLNYEELLEKAQIKTLEERRVDSCNNFMNKLVLSEQFGNLFPRNEIDFHMDLRHQNVYHEEFARSKRLYDSPLYSMRRMLNRK